jgi:hypothetical protein
MTRARLAAPALALVAVAAGTAWWSIGTPPATLRAQLSGLTFWWLEGILAVAIALAVASFSRLRRSLEATPRQLAAVLGASLLALALTGWAAPRTSRIFYDEQIYQGIGQNLADSRLAQMCNDGTVEYGRLECRSGEYNKQPSGYPHLLSLLYRIAGVGPGVAFRLNAAVAFLSVWAVFALATLLFGDALAGCFAALVMATLPMQLTWSHTAAVEPSAALAITLALVAAALFCRVRGPATAVLLAVMAAYASSFRTESVVIVPVTALAVLLLAPRELRRPATWWAAACGALLLAPLAAHLAAVRHESWGAAGVRTSLAYVAGNFATNGRFYVWDERFPAVCSLLAVAGGIVAVRRGQWRPAFLLAAAFAAFAGTYLLFYAGSYDYGADVRYALLTFPALAAMAGLGAASLGRWLDALGRPGVRGAVVVVAALLGSTLWYMPVVRAVGEEAWAARADVAFAERLRSEVAGNAVVLTHNPTVFHVVGINAAQASLATTSPEYVESELFARHAGRVYFYWNFWCNVQDPVQVRFCQNVLARFDAVVVKEYRERDYRFALYRLSRR